MSELAAAFASPGYFIRRARGRTRLTRDFSGLTMPRYKRTGGVGLGGANVPSLAVRDRRNRPSARRSSPTRGGALKAGAASTLRP